jgi:hypothetical protein
MTIFCEMKILDSVYCTACKSFSSISIGTNSELAHFATEAFAEKRASLANVPGNNLRVAVDSGQHHCDIIMAGFDSVWE